MEANIIENVEEPEYLLLASAKEGRWNYQDNQDLDVVELVYEPGDAPMKVRDGETEASVDSLFDEGHARYSPLIEDSFDTDQRGYLLTGPLEVSEDDNLSEGERLATRLDHLSYPNLDIYFVEKDEQQNQVYRDPFEGKISNDEEAESIIRTILNGGERKVLNEIVPVSEELQRKMNEYERITDELDNRKVNEETQNNAKAKLRKQMFKLHDTLVEKNVTLVSETRLDEFDNQIGQAERLLMQEDEILDNIINQDG